MATAGLERWHTPCPIMQIKIDGRTLGHSLRREE
jgi:hypothetical protein